MSAGDWHDERGTVGWGPAAPFWASPPFTPLPQLPPVLSPVPWSVPAAHQPLADLEAMKRIEEALAPQPAPPDPGPPPDLKQGDEVEALIGGKWVPAVFLHGWWRQPRYGGWECEVRRKGKTANGRRYPVATMSAAEVRLVRKYDPVRGNIYADYLEEQGFSEAADALRAAFPLARGEETP